jgi:hypothetical protein
MAQKNIGKNAKALAFYSEMVSMVFEGKGE